MQIVPVISEYLMRSVKEKLESGHPLLTIDHHVSRDISRNYRLRFVHDGAQKVLWCLLSLCFVSADIALGDANHVTP